jgi:class 3 adenylate cyclase/pimeloyl-ACP methyl ester carboxylesterase
MVEKHSGTITILITDVEQSTEVLQRLGDDRAQALWRTYLRILRNAVAVRGGQEVKNLGDGIMVVFGSALDAISCSVAMQQAVYHHNQNYEEDHRMQLRVGLHVGEPIHEEGDLFGTPVVVAHRLCNYAQGGQILVSDLVHRLVGSRGGFSFSQVESLPLKGLAEPLDACELLWKKSDKEMEARFPLPPLLMGGERSLFVGRERELKKLREVWGKAQRGESQVVFLAGDPGIGKSRLATEFSLATHAEGATVLFGGVEENAALPYQPFVEAFRHYTQNCLLDSDVKPGATESAHSPSELVESLAGSLAKSAASDSERYRIFDAFVDVIAQICSSRPLILLLDDLHWADKDTFLLLWHIIRSTRQLPLLIIGTYRQEEVERTHPLSSALADLRRNRSFAVISLKGLDEQGVGAMIGAWASRASPLALGKTSSFISALHTQTEGNPFFIEEVLRHLAEIGALQDQDGRQAFSKIAREGVIPDGIKDTIDKRLLRLSEECNSILTFASVIGREFGLEALELASGLPAEKLLELLEEAVAAHIINEVPHIVGRYNFSHALTYETLYDELTTTRRVHLHGQTLRYADSKGVKIAYEVLGSTGPFMMAVGLSNCAVARSMHWSIANRWDNFCKFCRVLLYDRRGVGFSAAPKRGYSLRASVEDMRAVLDAAGVERTIIWGATDGGPLAITFVKHYPERVSGLVLAGTTAKYLNSADYALGVNPSELESFRRSDDSDTGRAIAMLTRTRSSGGRADAIGEVMRRVPTHAWAKIMGAIGTSDARALLSEINVPTLIIHDPDNTYIPVESAHYLHENIAGSQLEVTEAYSPVLYGRNLFRTIERFIEKAHTHRSP